MSYLTHTALHLALLSALVLGSAHTALAASEVTGTLSSDGSTSAPQQETNGNIMTSGTEDPDGTLAGTVVGGIDSDDSGMTALVASAQDTILSESALWWLIPALALAAAIGTGYYFYTTRRRRI